MIYETQWIRTTANWLQGRRKVSQHFISLSELKQILGSIEDPGRTDIVEFNGFFYNGTIPPFVAFSQEVCFDSRSIDPSRPVRSSGATNYVNSSGDVIKDVNDFIGSYEGVKPYSCGDPSIRHFMDKEGPIEESIAIRYQIFEGKGGRKCYIHMQTSTREKRPYRGVAVDWTKKTA